MKVKVLRSKGLNEYLSSLASEMKWFIPIIFMLLQGRKVLIKVLNISDQKYFDKDFFQNNYDMLAILKVIYKQKKACIYIH